MKSETILKILEDYVGKECAINQYDLALIYTSKTKENITPREVRKVIEKLRFEGKPILSTSQIPGGYFMAKTIEEYFEWRDVERKKAKKQLAKIRPVRRGVLRRLGVNKILQNF